MRTAAISRRQQETDQIDRTSIDRVEFERFRQTCKSGDNTVYAFDTGVGQSNTIADTCGAETFAFGRSRNHITADNALRGQTMRIDQLTGEFLEELL
jgi:hypothetical protein